MARPGAPRASAALLLDLFVTMEKALGAEGPAAHANASRVCAADQMVRAHGVWSLQIAFLEHRGLSPRTILTGVRLERAREALIASHPDRSATDGALTCAYSRLGRFSPAYRARFGEAPRETLARRRH
jgi:AraC family carnitine catabolism transcriptional activator